MIYITGDTHIPIDVGKLSSKRFPEQKHLTDKDYLIICGDFGGIWNGDNEEKYWLKWFAEKKFTTLFVDGNHENHKMLNEDFPAVSFSGGNVHKINDKLFHLMRGQVYTIDGIKIFAFGGASSHDREKRKLNTSWWAEELPTNEEIETAVTNLDNHKWSVDVVITHCMASSVQESFFSDYEKNYFTDFLEEVKEKLSYNKWFFGHYHVDLEIDKRHIAIFNNVIKLK